MYPQFLSIFENVFCCVYKYNLTLCNKYLYKKTLLHITIHITTHTIQISHIKYITTHHHTHTRHRNILMSEYIHTHVHIFFKAHKQPHTQPRIDAVSRMLFSLLLILLVHHRWFFLCQNSIPYEI